MRKLTQLIFASSLCLANSSSPSEPLTCRKDVKYQLNELQNMDFELKGCYEHAGRTCCSEQDTIKIRLKYE